MTRHGAGHMRGGRRALNDRRRFPDRWDLSTLLRDPVNRLDDYLGELDKQVVRFEAWRTRLAPSTTEQDLFEVLRLSEEIARQSSMLGAYAYLWFSENTADLKARSFKAKVEEKLTGLHNRLLFFELWWQSIDEADAQRLMKQAGDFRYHLDTIRRFKPHTLTEPEEQIVNIKNVTGRTAMRTLYDVVTNGFSFVLRVQGRRKTFTRETLMAYLRHPKSTLREAAYRELYRVYAAHHDLLG
ncbi:MAG TPA: oligoendopeptidase F, partial [Nitrospiraceae bacterium]|nr:oligoendopeptidase F [Nitrospiraceae bacterium]